MSTTIDSLELRIVSNSKKATASIDALIASLDKLKKATQGIGLDGFSEQANKASKSAKRVATANGKAGDSYVDLAAKVTTAYMAVRKIYNVMKGWVNESTDYIESLNLFAITMGEYGEEAYNYGQTVSQAMGIDPADWMKNQAVFMSLGKGFGVAGDRAALMSQQLTQLGYDLTSFFGESMDMTVEEAMQKLQSGIAGELEPLRRLGYDLSQAKLEATALSLGIDKAVSSMTQAEKAELRYYAIMTQVTDAHGDMARTLDQPANAIRVLKAEITQLARTLGDFFIPILNKTVPYITAAVRVFRELLSTLLGFMGINLSTVDWGKNTIADVTEGANENLEEAEKSAKKLKSYLMGFDELNIINPADESSGADETATGGGFGFELPTYDFLEGLVDTNIDEIVQKMKEWLGITGDIDSWSELFETRLGRILIAVTNIAGGIALWKVTKGFLDAITALNTLLKSPTYTILISATLMITGFAGGFSGLKKAIEEGMDGGTFAETVGNFLLGTAGATILGSKIATWLGAAFKSPKIAFALAHIGKNMGLATSGAVGGALAASIAGIVAGIPTYIVGIVDAIKNGISVWSAALIGAGATAAGAGIGAIIGALGGPVTAGIGALIGLAVGAVTDLVILVVQKWDVISAFFVDMWEGIVSVWNTFASWCDTNVIQPVVGFFSGLWTSVSGFFVNLWDDIVGIWNSVASWFDTVVIQPVVAFFEGAMLRIGQFFEGCWLIVKAVWKIVSEWFNEKVIIPVVEFFKGLWEDVSSFFSQLWADIVAIWELVSAWFNEKVIQPVVKFFKGVWTSVSGFFSSLWEDIKGVWKSVSTWFKTTIIDPIEQAFDTACQKIGEFFSGLWLGIRQGVAKAMNGVIGAVESAINWVVGGINSLIGGFNKVVQWAADVLGANWGGVTLVGRVSFSRIEVPQYADGGFPDAGQMFIAREAGAEMVGSIGRRTAVVNNDQIVDGIASGVAEANNEQNYLLREQNTILRALLEKDSGVYLDGRSLTNSVERYQRERGRQLVTGGAI